MKIRSVDIKIPKIFIFYKSSNPDWDSTSFHILRELVMQGLLAFKRWLINVDWNLFPPQSVARFTPSYQNEGWILYSKLFYTLDVNTRLKDEILSYWLGSQIWMSSVHRKTKLINLAVPTYLEVTVHHWHGNNSEVY